MGVDLVGHGGESLNWRAWRSCLELARSFGWNPEGTKAPDRHEGECPGYYCSNDYQLVTKTDARAIANALQRAVEVASSNARLTTEQENAIAQSDLRVAHRLALYALSGQFLIG